MSLRNSNIQGYFFNQDNACGVPGAERIVRNYPWTENTVSKDTLAIPEASTCGKVSLIEKKMLLILLYTILPSATFQFDPV